MTLIIGRVINGNVYLFGDTELTLLRADKRKNPFIEGCLKLYIIQDHMAIGFAGIKRDFEQSYNSFMNYTDSNDIAKIAITSQMQGMDYELLIAEIGCDKIKLIKNGKISETEAGYIGDPNAFNAYQRYYHTLADTNGSLIESGRASIQMLQLPEPLLEEGKIYYRMYTAFKQVIWDEQIVGVGGVIVPLCTHKGVFQYMYYADVVSDILNIEDFQDNPTPIRFGTAEGGGYSVEFGSDLSNGGLGREIGYYFLQGGFGVVFPKKETGLRDAKLIQAKNPAFWVMETTRELGHGISSGYLSEVHCMLAGEAMLKENKFEEAKVCYQLRKDSKAWDKEREIRDRYMAGYATSLFNCGQATEAIDILKTEISSNSDTPYCRSQIEQILTIFGIE